MRFWSWVSNEFSLIPEGGTATLCPWVRSLSASDAAESAIVKGAGRGILGTTDPTYTPGEGSLEVTMKAFREFARSVTNNGAVRLGDLDFTFSIKRKSRTETEAMIDTVEFQFTGWDDAGAQGSADPLVSTLSLLITDIKRNGVGL